MFNYLCKMRENIIDNKIKYIIVLFFGVLTLLVSWNSDDAYHAYVMAKNLVEGNGLVYNVGYRVTASTCPLFTILTAVIYTFLGHSSMFFAGIILGVICSTIAIYIFVFKMCKNNETSWIAVCILLGCYCFMTYTTAGLENSLLFLLSVIFMHVFSRREILEAKDLFLLALLLSLLAMTRMDSVLLFLPAICLGYIFFSKIKFIKRVFAGFFGLLPFVAWEIFSLIYYGYLFPNTMYVKLNTGFPKKEYIARGIDFIYRSSCVDILLIVIPIVFCILSICWKHKKMIMISSGCLLYIMYVINIGGDFMVGRHLTVPFFVSLLGLVILFNSREGDGLTKISLKKFLLIFLFLELVWATCFRPIAKMYLYEVTWDVERTGVADERAFYYPYMGTIPYVCSMYEGFSTIETFLRGSELDKILDMRDNNNAGYLTEFLNGITNYYVQESGNIYLTDPYGLMDPLLSHLPALEEDHWRIGHMRREIPEGYRESIETGKNEIVNNSLHEYYDKILLIISGDIWDRERIRTIIDMNLGRYDYLLDDYLNSL